MPLAVVVSLARCWCPDASRVRAWRWPAVDA